MSSVKKAILLSAGFGTRLKPLTNKLPKCLVPIGGKPLLQIWLEQLTKAGFTEFLINTHYLSEQVVIFVEQSEFKQLITLVHEPELLGTLGTLKSNNAFWQGENVLVAHADNLCLCSWQSFIQAFDLKPKNCLGTMMLFESDDPSSCGIVKLDDKNRVIDFHEKVENPPSNLANGAIYLFDQAVYDVVNSINIDTPDISIDLIPLLLGKLSTWQADGYLRDIGNINSLEKANIYFNQQ